MTVHTGSASIPTTRSMLQVVEFEQPRVPTWVSRLFDEDIGDPGAESLQRIDEAALLAREIPHADRLDDASFQAAVDRLYSELLSDLERLRLQPVRIWNYVPNILAPGERVSHRYMVFNAGRFAAYERFFGDRTCFSTRVPTASGTGTTGHRFVLHCLAMQKPGIPMENHRQIPAYHYSKRYGASPPCFARATSVCPRALGLPLPEAEHGTVLLVGGTASIRGETSRHIGRLDQQFSETVRNLEALLESEALRFETHGAVRSGNALPPAPEFREIRVYHPRAEDRERIRTAIERQFPQLRTLELVTADLCRPELLIEIEGIAWSAA